MKRLLFIYNPQAGKGIVKNHLANIVDIFTKADYLVTVWPTQGKEDATRVAARQGWWYDRVVCCGGDGTLSETVSGLLTLETPPVLGYLPAGTTNDFSRNLGLPRGLEKAALTAVEGTPRPCDMGRFNDRYFVYVAAFGIFTDVSYGTPQEFKNAFGHLAYLLEGATKLGDLGRGAVGHLPDAGGRLRLSGLCTALCPLRGGSSHHSQGDELSPMDVAVHCLADRSGLPGVLFGIPDRKLTVPVRRMG